MMAASARSYSAGKLLSPGADGCTAGSGQVRDMRERGFAVLIVDVLNAEPRTGRAQIGRLARRNTDR
jgi:hypothetical protein